MDIRLQSMARQKLIQAYAAIPDTLHHRFPPLKDTTTRHQRARDWHDDRLLGLPSTTNTSHRYLLTIATKLGPGFPRVVLAANQRIRRLKGVYRSRMCDPHNPLFPKLIEVRNRRELPPPSPGDYLEIEELTGCVVKQVGGFANLKSWYNFPFKGAGGVGLDDPKEIHDITYLDEAAFESGQVWWALLEFPW
jgi:hypothetical protein